MNARGAGGPVFFLAGSPCIPPQFNPPNRATRAMLAAFIFLAVATTTYAAENGYDFTVTGEDGEVLGSGKILLPFKLGADGKGTVEWQFTPTQTASTNSYWLSAKARLAAGNGKANAECKASWFTLDFNPGWADNNVTVSWAVDKEGSGTLYFGDFSGGHPCALFRIARRAEHEAPRSGDPALPSIPIRGSNAISSATGAPPDERDRQVLEVLLLHLLSDPKLDLTKVPPEGATIVLHARTPEKTGFLMSEQIHSDIRKRTLPDDTEKDLRRRNTPAEAKSGRYEAVTAYYTNLGFAAGIVVTNLSEIWQDRRSFRSFEDAHPKARGWLEAYLPGYSEDGTHAIVRGGVGPWAHAAMLTAVLEKRGGKWVVKWYHIAFYL